MSRIKTPNRSFSTRLSLWFTGCSAAILLAAMGVSLYFVYNKIKQDTIVLSQHSLQIFADEISNTFHIAEVTANNLSPVVQHFLATPDSIGSLLKPILDNNGDLYGASVEIEPSYYGGKLVAPYLCRTEQEGVYRQDTIYAFWEEDWYKETKRMRKSFWTKPFFGRVGKKKMTEYCTPLFDSQNNFIGVFEVDITLEWIEKMLDRQKISKNSFIQVLDNQGNEVVALGEPLKEKSSYTYKSSISKVGWQLNISSSEKEIMRPVRLLRDILLLLFVVGLTALLFATRLVVDKLAKPVIRFARAADEISKGNFNTVLPDVRTEDELMLLRDSLDDMQHELSSYIEDLRVTTESQARIENELQIASNIQQDMLPKTFLFGMYAQMKPAREVGGDLFDYLLKEDDLYFIIGDVSGKGIPASLLMAVTCKLFRNVAHHVDHPGRIVTSINHSLSENNRELVFVTLFVGMLNLKSGKLTYCNAGHNPPLMITGDGVDFLSVESNTAAGVLCDSAYIEQTVTLSIGDRILLYTDGVTEAKNLKGEYYGEPRLIKVAEESKGSSTQKQVEYILDDIADFSLNTEQNDDITIFNIEF